MIIDCRTAGRLTGALGAAAALAIAGACATRASTAPRFAVSFPESSGLTAVDGRVLVMLSTSDRQEPRFQVSDSDQTAQIFGVDVDGLRPGVDATVGETTPGNPIASLSDVPPGEYWCRDCSTSTKRSRGAMAIRSSCRPIVARASSGCRRPATCTASRARCGSIGRP